VQAADEGRVTALARRARTLLSLNARPKASQIIYHYCKPDAFWSVIGDGKFWLSDIFSLNDSEELRWGRQILTNVLQENHGLFNDDFRYLLIMRAFGIDPHVRPFVGAFSANGDLLSQWRAYAADGRGYALGLKASKIYDGWGVRMKKIEYREAHQKSILLESLTQLQTLWRNDPKTDPTSPMVWFDVLNEFAVDLCSFKHPSFSEEKEYRVIRLILRKGEGENSTFADPGARSKGDPLQVRKRVQGSSEVAYVEVSIDSERVGTIVKEVILGPKNDETPEVVRSRIEAAGFHEFGVRRSFIPYR
jgi:hypothetical protein